MLNIPVTDCCGCTACYNVCANDAIQMLADKEGFCYPYVNNELCVECGFCERVCPILNPPEISSDYKECYVAQNSNYDVLDTSTSGGFIDTLYEYVINGLEGYGVGVAYSSKFLPTHIITDSYDKAREFRNSKYAQSDLGNVFKNIQSVLQKGEYVLFVGTPCQVSGLKAFLLKDYSNLITVDLVCRSVPSPKLWREYLDFQEKKHKSRIEKVACRKKTYGYHSGSLEIEFKNGKRYSGSNRVDYYMKSFHNDLCSRQSCYNCKFKTKHRCSDFTVFDSWNPEAVVDVYLRDNDRGYSNVIVHTEKGAELLKKIINITLVKADPEKMFEFTGGMESNSITKKNGRETFYKDIDQFGFKQGVLKYINVSIKDLLIEKLKPIRYFIKKKIKK